MKRLIAIMILLIASCASRQISATSKLDLSNHRLSEVPDSVFTLTNLEYLQLGNSLTLYPPLSALGGDSFSDKTLNRITVLPTRIENLHKLRVLGLCCNNLQTFPKQLIKLENLVSLDLSFNENLSIADVAEAISQMPWLKYVNLVGTKTDTTAIERLRKMLPKTRIDTKFEDLESEP